MEGNKVLLVLEDLGIAREEFKELLENIGLDYRVIWKETDAPTSEVEVLINIKKKLDKECLRGFPNLKMIGVAFTGYDSVDLAYCKDHNIAVYNVPAYSTKSVTELTIGLTISLLREIPKSDRIIRNKQWKLAPGIELSGKTVGILGTGKIGVNTARVFKALGCELIAWSRTQKSEFKALGGQYVADKETLFSQADIVSVHLPYNTQTKHAVGKAELKAMKKTAFLINTARGPIVDEQALITALKNKELAGAGLDVYSVEPIQVENELLTLDNVVLTPHIAFNTEEALVRRAQTTAENVQHFLEGKSKNRVN